MVGHGNKYRQLHDYLRGVGEQYEKNDIYDNGCYSSLEFNSMSKQFTTRQEDSCFSGIRRRINRYDRDKNIAGFSDGII